MLLLSADLLLVEVLPELMYLRSKTLDYALYVRYFKQLSLVGLSVRFVA
jgi:hypothetical protein